MHMDMLQDAFYGEIIGKMLDASVAASIEHRALTLTARTPQCGHTVWGNMPIFTTQHGTISMIFVP